MKIAQIGFSRINNALGGTEKVFFTLANELVNRGHSVANIYYDNTPGKPLFPVDEKVLCQNCAHFRFSKVIRFFARLCSIFLPDRKKRIQMRDLPRRKAITNSILKFKPDVVLIYWPNIIIEDLNKLGIPIIQMMHMAPSFFLGDKKVIFYKKSIEDCAGIQVLLPDYIEELRKSIPNKHIVSIPNIVPQYEERADASSHTIIFVGRIAGQKRPWLIPQAFALIKDKYPDWKIELWGEYDVEPETTTRVRQIIKETDLEKRILLCGISLDIKSQLKKASIVLMPSRIEGFSLAMTEAMSMGLPIVACNDCPSIASIVHHNENGMLCDPSAEDIALHLSRLMDSHELREKLGTQAKEDMKLYNADSVCKQWETLMKEVIERKIQE